MSLLSHIVDNKITHLLLRNFISRQLEQTIRYQHNHQRHTIRSSSGSTMTEKSFLPKRALVLRKFSRLEYERMCHPNLSEEQLATNVSYHLQPELVFWKDVDVVL